MLVYHHMMFMKTLSSIIIKVNIYFGVQNVLILKPLYSFNI